VHDSTSATPLRTLLYLLLLMQLKTQFRSVFDLAQSYETLSGSNDRCLKRIFQVCPYLHQQLQVLHNCARLSHRHRCGFIAAELEFTH
jgi:hypothetical protein